MSRLFPLPSLRPFVFGTTVLIVVFLVGCSGSQPPVYKQGDAYVLRMRANEGDVYEGAVSMDQTMDMNVRGQSMQMEQSQTMDYRYDFTDATADSLTMKRILTRARGSVTTPMGGAPQSYDTASDSSAGTASQIRSMIGVPVSLRLSRRGEVARVIGMETLIDSLSGASGGANAMMNQMLDPETVKQNVTSTYGFYPSEPVAIGDSWTTRHAMNMGVPFTIDATYTLRSVEGTTALLDAQYAVSSPDSSDGMRINGMTMKMTMDGSMEGVVRMDLVSGMMKRSTMDMNMSADAEIIPPMGNQTVEMQMAIDGAFETMMAPHAETAAAQTSK